MNSQGQKVRHKSLRTRIVAVLAVLFLAVALTFLSVYIVSNLNHDCTHDESCHVCVCVEACKKLASDIGLASMAVAVALALGFGGAVVILSFWAYVASSPIHLKTRLNQ